MIALLLAIAAQAAPLPSVAPSVLGSIGRQQLPAKGCAAYLWNATDRQLVAMAVADPATLRLSIGGRTIDLVRAATEGNATLGFGASTDYRAEGISARLTMEVVRQEGLTAGAKVPTGSLQVDRRGQDGVIVPVAGLIGCAA